MLKELENLLRDIAQQQGVNFPNSQNRPPRPGKISASGRTVEEYDDLEVIDAVPVEAVPVAEDFQSHVRRHMDTTDVTAHVSHLGERVGLADDKLDARLHSKFDHALGRLGQDEVPANAEAIGPNIANDIVRMFQNPDDVRRAIILNELLSPPRDMW